ncbi:hypothetical protein NEHOM01_0065 [Nematocida homosporus]|uniref:uncharacterized protein n=1 Tax=Nematocida homosporus TaxID=1912981 RepID=UPI0022205CA7|nr:uncharacterized protein NEHOM01_0065 [Nematocida homosporus]KAI5184320.1 hypothetical protein NEHOM01_0065 [Nematocida homosporus]
MGLELMNNKKLLTACASIVQVVSEYYDRAQKGEVAGYCRTIPRELGKLSEKDKSVVDNDVPRTHLYLSQDHDINSSEAEYKKMEVTTRLTKLGAILESNGFYRQGMLDACLPIVYAFWQQKKSEEETIDKCLAVIEGFIWPLAKNELALYVKYESIMKQLPGYRPVSPDIPKADWMEYPIEAWAILPWFTTIFDLCSLAQVYGFLLKSPLRMSFLLFLALQPLARERKSNYKGAPLAESQMEGYLDSASKLDQKFGHEFTAKSLFKEPMVMIGMGVAVVALGVAGAFAMYDYKNRKP